MSWVRCGFCLWFKEDEIPIEHSLSGDGGCLVFYPHHKEPLSVNYNDRCSLWTCPVCLRDYKRIHEDCIPQSKASRPKAKRKRRRE